jgi:phosphoserine phosphatase RsbU/P
MALNRGISLRYKILGLMTAIPFVTLATYLYLASSIFREDKIAYVYDSTTAVSGTMAAQVRSEMNAVLNLSRVLLQEYLNTKSFSGVSSVVFKNDTNLDLIAAYEKTEAGIVGKAMLEKEEGEGKNLLSSLPYLSYWLVEAEKTGRIVKAPFMDDRVLLIERAGITGQSDFVLFVLVVHLRELRDLFNAPGATQVSLSNEDGTVIFGQDGSVGKNLNQNFDISFLEQAKKDKKSSGTSPSVGVSGDDLLVSFAKVGFGDLVVTTAVDRSDALAALQKLMGQSIIFFGILITLTAIVALFASGVLTSALTSLFEATTRVAEGRFDIRVKVASTDEIGSLAESFNIMAAEVARLLEATASKARMEAELKTAQTVQETLFPASEAELSGLNIAGYYEPASECGGDWWHYCKVGKKVFLWIGDATGHGAPAALITSAARSASTIIERLDVSPGQALSLLNRAIYDVSKGKIMMTFFLASFDPETGEFTYANASHESPYLLKQTESAPKKKDLIPLNEVNNPRLGQSRDTVYSETKLNLDKGDRILFYTDGIPDINNPQKVPWGEREFLKAILSSNSDYPTVVEAVSRISKKFQEHRQQEPLIDDITFFMCKYEGTP